ncbi:MAG TPA: DUF1697 domain-containing protein [Lacunisphaera sp.]|nr:DUF1697 domain-containing protein [Lacunisphaera sp.]
MPRPARHDYIAFLRGINLGARRPPMAGLRAIFTRMKFTEVATFIASGNVIFSDGADDRSALEARIEQGLARSLGYPVDTFVRTRAEVAAIAAAQPFSPAESAGARAVHVVMLKEPLSRRQVGQLAACATATDAFAPAGREFHWLCRIKTNESKVWSSPAMKALRLPTCSMRNVTTLRNLAALYPPRTG